MLIGANDKQVPQYWHEKILPELVIRESEIQ